MPDIYAQAEAFRLAVARRDANAAGRLASAYRSILERLQKDLDKLLVRIEAAKADGERISKAWLQREERYKALIAQAREQLALYGRGVLEPIEGRRAAELLRGAEDAAALVSTAANVGASFNVLPVSAIENMTALVSKQSPLAKLLLRDFKREGADHISDVLLRGVGAGWNPNKMAAEMRKAIELPRHRAQAIARTESLRAYRLATLETYKANSHIGTQYRWLCAKGTRTCLNCLSRDGSLWPTSQPMPVHVNCRCTMILVTATTPPPRTTGAQWFERQSDETKREMLRSQEAFELYKAGRIRLKDFEGRKESAEWGASTYQRSLREILGRPKRVKAT